MVLVVLSLGNGNLHNGFPTVTAQLWEQSNSQPIKFTGCLPASPEIAELYKYWQLLYSAVYQRLDLNPRIEIDAVDVTNVSSVEFSHLCQRLSTEINIWLNSESFRHIEQQLRTYLHSDAEIRFIIETSDNLLKRLPWHLWKFFEDYPKAEVALSATEYQKPKKSITNKHKSKLRILAIFGNSKGIDLRRDRIFLEQLSDKAEIKFLVEPQLESLHDRLWQEWDILFFAGHSYSKEQGIIQLNQTDAIALDSLKFALRNAINKGLKLAIFNSCDGLGLAQALFDLHIPQVIVMREPVPDVVAQEFLKHFLETFSRGGSLYTSVREARERLQKLEGKYPCATWLPVICQNPAQMPFIWLVEKKRSSFKASYQRLQKMLLASVVVTSLIMGVRQLGMLQGWELQAFDSLIRLRSDEKPDPRLLIVTVTEKDIQKQNIKEMRSLSDGALMQLLKKIQPHQPQVIGLDIYRNFPVDSNYADLKTYLQDRRFIAVCEVGENDYKGIGKPPEVPQDQISFSDFPVDGDGVIRRQLLGMAADPNSFCSADISFSFRVALNYLSSLGVESKLIPENKPYSERYWQIGNVVFKKLESDAGGYQQLDALGYQVLLNYRSSVAKQVSLYDILNGSLDDQLPNLVKNKIVLIGTTAKSFKDYFKTPLSAGQSEEELPGVIIHAQMVSQIISAVLDGRSLLWWLPGWGETLWIWSWSIVGGILVGLRSQFPIGGAIVFALIILSGLCFVVLLLGGWIPLVPSALALLLTSLIIYRIFQ